jgi:hypothetical protein
VTEQHQEAAAEQAEASLLVLHRPWLQMLLEAISHRQELRTLVDAAIAGPLLVAGTDSLLEADPHYMSALLGFGIGIPFAAAIIETSIAIWQLRTTAIVFIGCGMERFVKIGYHDALLPLLIGIPPAVPLLVFRSLNPYQQYISYCYGAFLGPIVCYHFVILWCIEKIGLDLEPGLTGYFVAMLVGMVLAVEMPIVDFLHKRNVRVTGVGGGAAAGTGLRPASMIPLSFAVGMLTGFGTMLALSAFGLMLLWPVGYVVAPLLLMISIYALRPQ